MTITGVENRSIAAYPRVMLGFI